MSNGFAVASFILGLISLFFGWIPLLGWAIIILALVFGIIGFKKSKQTNAGKGFATAGIALSSVALIIAPTVAIVAFTYNPPIIDTTTSGELTEWKDRILKDTGSNSEPSKTLAQCEAALEQSVIDCSSHDGWRVINVMEITDFKTDNPYSFEERQEGGCSEKAPDGTMYPKTAETATIITQSGSSTEYQVTCNIVCNWWECTDNTKDNAQRVNQPETWTGIITAQLDDSGDACGGASVSITYDITLNSPLSLVSALNGENEITLWSEPGYKETSGTIQGIATVDIQPPRSGVIYCELEDGTSEDVPITFFATGGDDQKIQLSEPPDSQQNIRTPRFGHKYYYHEEAGLTDDSVLVGFPPILDTESISDTEITGSLRPGFGYTGTFELRKS